MGSVHPLPFSTRSRRIQSINPATGEELQSFEPLSPEQVDEKIAAAMDAFKAYRKTSFARRSEILRRAAGILESGKEHWGRIMTLEMGKPLGAAKAEAEKCALTCRYYAENAKKMLRPRKVATQADESYYCFQPIGPVLAIMPWNFPFWQVIRFAAPALMAGNVALLKHAANVPQCALAIEEIFRLAGLPSHVFQALLIGSERVKRILEDPRVAAVTLTGSDVAGSRVASEAGRNLKKCVLELGGSDPFIVMPSADLGQAVRTGVTARNINNGQSCIAAKRFLVHEAIYEEFESRFARAVAELKVGDPMDPSTDIGPLANYEILERLDEQVAHSIRAGARALVGGRRRGGPGFFYEPTVLASIPKDAPAYSEEIFGPVALLFKVKDLSDAIRLANSSRFGLGSSLWSTDPEEHRQFVDEIESGLAFINAMVASDPRLPFGGVKHSGFGRELGEVGIHEFVNIKTVWKSLSQPGPSHRSATE